MHDPVVNDAACHAVSSIQQRSNSLLPYELLDIIHAKAEVIPMKLFLVEFGTGFVGFMLVSALLILGL